LEQHREAIRKLEESLNSVRLLTNGVTNLQELEKGMDPLWERVRTIEHQLEPFLVLQRELENLWATVQGLEEKLAPMEELQRELRAVREEMWNTTRKALQ